MTSRPGRGAGAGRRERHRQEPRSDGRHQSGQCRAGHHPQGFRRIDRGQFGARLRRAGNRRATRSRSSSAISISSRRLDARRSSVDKLRMRQQRDPHLSLSNGEPFSMQGKTVVITGATSGIGEVAAVRLAEQGARIVFIARDPERAAVTMAKLRTGESRQRTTRSHYGRSFAARRHEARGGRDRRREPADRRADQQCRRAVQLSRR